MSGVDTLELNQQALELLGALPYFDVDLGVDVVALLRQRDGDEHLRWANQYLFDLVAAGLLEDVQGLMRVPAYQRGEYAGPSWAERDALTGAALQRFASAASNGLRDDIERIIGPRGTDVLVQAVRVVAEPPNDSEFDALAETIQESGRLGRANDARNAAATLRRFLSETDRRRVFLDAMAKWQSGARAEAAEQFRLVLQSKIRDKAEGIAAHLLATFEHESGVSASETTPLLARAEKALRYVDDPWGLSLTLTTHGRVLRDHAKETDPPSEKLLTNALHQYERARKTLARVPLDDLTDPRRSFGRIDLGRAEVLADLRQLDAAIELAEQTLKSLREGSEEKLYARTLLARLYRDENRISDALDVLNSDTIRRVRATRRADYEIAKALNILATVQRRSGDLPGAQQSAEESLEIGQQLSIGRHIAHAATNLAAIRTERLQPTAKTADRDVREIRSLLYLARNHGAFVDDQLAQLPSF